MEPTFYTKMVQSQLTNYGEEQAEQADIKEIP